MKSKNQIILLLVVFLIFLVGMVFITKKKENGGLTACTMEAKICPDGSSVGREGPFCDFKPCPTTDGNIGTQSNEPQHISFEYPKEIGTTYIKPVDWPPTINASLDPFSCTVAGSETAQAGRTENKLIHGQIYCITKVVEGAAGSMYTQYAYTSAKEGKAVTMAFTLKSVQCGNYDDPLKTACENERNAFNIDEVVHQMFQSVKFSIAP